MARKSSEFKLNAEQQQMAVDNLNLARDIAWKIQRLTGIEYSVLEGAAFIGLCKACFKYDPSTGYKFSSLATPTIKGELLHWVRDRTYAVRLSHKFRELWQKGKKMLYSGMSDIEVAKYLEINLQTWLEVKSVCYGPPLELKDQAVPTEPLEPEEIDFKSKYRVMAFLALEEASEREKNAFMSFYKGDTSKPPAKMFNVFIANFAMRNLL